MKTAVAVLAVFFIGLGLGLWYASRERTCAMVHSNQGNVVLCSNSYKSHLTL